MQRSLNGAMSPKSYGAYEGCQCCKQWSHPATTRSIYRAQFRQQPEFGSLKRLGYGEGLDSCNFKKLGLSIYKGSSGKLRRECVSKHCMYVGSEKSQVSSSKTTRGGREPCPPAAFYPEIH